MDLSVVVPLYFEEDSVKPMYDAITQAIDPLKIEYEMVFVNDGSTDKTFSIAKQLAEDDPKLRVINFRKNYGQTPAMAAGIDHAKGKIIVTMDGDLQNDPSDIPLFLEKMAEGYDIVVGWRHKRQDKLVTRKIPSMIANRLIGKVTGVPIKDNGCSLKAYKAEIMQNVPFYSEMHRFIPAMSSTAGTNVAEIKVKHHARQFGESKYGLSRIYKVLLDLITIKTLISFSYQPALWFTLLGIPALALGLIMTIYGLNSLLFDSNSSSMIMLGSGTMFLCLFMFMFFWGMVGELIFKTGTFKPDVMARITLTTSNIENLESKDNKNDQ